MENTKHPGGRPDNGKPNQRNDNLFKYCPCPRRNWPKCPHGWYARVRYNGRSQSTSLNKFAEKPRTYRMSKTDAARERDKFRSQVHAGTFNAAPSAVLTARTDGQLTLREVATRHHEHCSTDPNRRAHRLPILKQALDVICRAEIDDAPFGDKAVDALTTADLEKFRGARRAKFRAEEARLAERRAKLAAGDADARRQAVSAELPHAKNGETGINRALELLRKVMNWAIEHGHRTSESPFTRHGRPCFKFAPEQGRRRRLRDGEEERLLAHASPHLRTLIVAALETGCRRGELLGLQWKDILLNAKGQPRSLTLRPEVTKTNRARTIPISETLRALLDMRRNGPDGEPLPPDAHVFGNEVGEPFDSIKSAWTATCRRADVGDLHFHDLRREAASRWLEAGVALLTVSYLLGHAQVTTTNSYSASSDVVAERELLAFQRRQRLVTKAASAAKSKAKLKPSAVCVH